MFDFKKKDDLVSIKYLNELLQKFNKKEEIEEKKINAWLIFGLIALSLVVVGTVVYLAFFRNKEDDYDDYDDDFEDLEYDEDYDDFDEYEDFDEDEDDFEEEDLEDDYDADEEIEDIEDDIQ